MCSAICRLAAQAVLCSLAHPFHGGFRRKIAVSWQSLSSRASVAVSPEEAIGSTPFVQGIKRSQMLS